MIWKYLFLEYRFLWLEQLVGAAIWHRSSCYALSADSSFEFCRVEATWRKEKRKSSVGDVVYYILSYPADMPCLPSKNERNETMLPALSLSLYIEPLLKSFSVSSYTHSSIKNRKKLELDLLDLLNPQDDCKISFSLHLHDLFFFLS